MDNEILVKTIKNTCKSFGITVSQLEKELGYSPSLISRWAKTSPSIDKIVEIADYFNVHIDDLIGRTLKSNKPTSEQFINTLFNMTVDRTLEWTDMTDCIPSMEIDEKYQLEDSGYNNRELFGTCYNEGSFWIYAQYDKEKGNISDIYIEIYIQPDSNSSIVLQDVKDESAEKLWIYVHTLLFGTITEIKAEEFKNAFVLNKSLINGNDVLSGGLNDKPETEILAKVANDPAVRQFMELCRKPEFQEMQQVMTSPEFKAAIEAANKIKKTVECRG